MAGSAVSASQRQGIPLKKAKTSERKEGTEQEEQTRDVRVKLETWSAASTTSSAIVQRLIESAEQVVMSLSEKPHPPTDPFAVYIPSEGAVKVLEKLSSQQKNFDEKELKNCSIKFAGGCTSEEIIAAHLVAEKARRCVDPRYTGLHKIEIKRIAANDPRVELRGQRGAFVAFNPTFQKREVVAVYTGYLILESERCKLVGDLQELSFDAFSFELPASELELKSDKLVVSACGEFGNASKFINDFRILPSDPVTKKDEKRINCEFVNCVYRGVPYVLVVTTRSIKAQQELLLDYSRAYWEALPVVVQRRAQNKQRIEAFRSLFLGLSPDLPLRVE